MIPTASSRDWRSGEEYRGLPGPRRSAQTLAERFSTNMDKEFINSELIKCNQCGYCLRTCPTYQATLTEATTARGRNTLLRDLVAGDIPDDEALGNPFFDCLLCGACTVECFTSVKTDELMVQARQQFYETHGEPPILHYIFHKLLPSPRRLTYLMRLFSLGKRSGLSSLARRLGILGWIDATLEGAEGLVARMPRQFLRDRLTRLGFVQHDRGSQATWALDPPDEARSSGPRVAYFIGCGTNLLLPWTGEAAIKVLSLAGCQIIVVEHKCCGLPPYSYGDLAAARHLARENIQIFQNLDADLIVTECGSCSSFLKDYAELLADDSQFVEPARKFTAAIRDFTEILPELSLPEPTRTGRPTVTYHDPCHLVRGQQIVDQPRQLLVDAGGVVIDELPEADWCCGGAGSYNISHPEMSLRILDRKLRRVAETKADVVTTACPACIIQLSYGLRQRADRRPMRHVAEIIAEGQGLAIGE